MPQHPYDDPPSRRSLGLYLRMAMSHAAFAAARACAAPRTPLDGPELAGALFIA